MHLLDMLKKENIKVNVCDPHAKEQVENNIDIYEAVKDASIMVLGVNHSEFENIDFSKISTLLKDKNILDTRNFFNREEIVKNNINYYLLGEK